MDDSTMRAVKAALRRIRFSRDGDLEVEVGGEEGAEEPMAEELEASDEDMPEAEADEYDEEDDSEVELPPALRRGRRER